MRVLLVNGSPKAKGNTAGALDEIAAVLEQQGIETKTFQLGGDPIRDCIGCGGCVGKSRCVFDDDVVNRLIDEAKQADGFVFGTPVYYAHPSGRILSALDRAFYAGSAAFRKKPGAAVAVARRYDGLRRRAEQVFHDCGDAGGVLDLLECGPWPDARRGGGGRRGPADHAQPGPQSGLAAPVH